MERREARSRTRRALWELGRAVDAGALGALDALRAFAVERGVELDHAADARLLLRQVAHAGLLPHGDRLEVVAATLSALAPLYPTTPAGPWAREPPALEAVCDALALGDLGPVGDACRALSEPGEPPTPPFGVFRLVGRHAADRALPHRVAHAVASLRARHAEDPEQVRRSVYGVALRALASALETQSRPPIGEAEALLSALEEIAFLRPVPMAARAGLCARLRDTLALPLHERPAAVEAVLLTDEGVDDLYASREDLARLVASWG